MSGRPRISRRLLNVPDILAAAEQRGETQHAGGWQGEECGPGGDPDAFAANLRGAPRCRLLVLVEKPGLSVASCSRTATAACGPGDRENFDHTERQEA